MEASKKGAVVYGQVLFSFASRLLYLTCVIRTGRNGGYIQLLLQTMNT